MRHRMGGRAKQSQFARGFKFDVLGANWDGPSHEPSDFTLAGKPPCGVTTSAEPIMPNKANLPHHADGGHLHLMKRRETDCAKQRQSADCLSG